MRGQQVREGAAKRIGKSLKEKTRPPPHSSPPPGDGCHHPLHTLTCVPPSPLFSALSRTFPRQHITSSISRQVPPPHPATGLSYNATTTPLFFSKWEAKLAGAPLGTRLGRPRGDGREGDCDGRREGGGAAMRTCSATIVQLSNLRRGGRGMREESQGKKRSVTDRFTPRESGTRMPSVNERANESERAKRQD